MIRYGSQVAEGVPERKRPTSSYQVAEGVPEKKCPTSFYRKQKNIDAKRFLVKKSKLGQPKLGEADVEGIGMSFVGERDTLLVRGTDRSGSTNGTERSRTPSGSDHAESGDAKGCFNTSTDLADTDATSFPGGPSDLSPLPSLLGVPLSDESEEIKTRPRLTIGLSWLKDWLSEPKKGEEKHDDISGRDVYPSPEVFV
ncbi:hypothetical protein Scep_016888 [Stephania cephalantha]|uniref:Uncharacterized protein n=1 Tax=Stephania cephalantha TaxID=152367 RepID=A0AAP0NV48_9MAGN